MSSSLVLHLSSNLGSPNTQFAVPALLWAELTIRSCLGDDGVALNGSANETIPCLTFNLYPITPRDRLNGFAEISGDFLLADFP